MKKTLPYLVAGLALSLSLTACGGDSQAAPNSAGSESSTPVSGGTLVFADVVNVANAQTQTATAYPQSNILHSVLDRLTYFDVDKGEVVPWIAEKFESNANATEYTFTIREGVTFSDGSPLDAGAVKANIDFLAKGKPEAQIPANIDFATVKSTKVDGNNVVVTLSEANSNFLRATAAITAGLVSLGTIELDNAGQSDISKIVASGPFVFESQVPDQETVFAKRADYKWAPSTAENQGAAYIDKLVVKAIPEVGLRAGAVQSGQVDVVRGLQPADEAALEASGSQVLPSEGIDLTSNIMGVRVGNEITADEKVRQALQIGVDRTALKDAVLSDSYTPAASILNHGSPGFVDLSAELAYNPEKANQLLDEAGWVKGEDGIRVNGGKQLKLSAAASSNSVVIKPAFEFVEQQWRELGVILKNRAGDNTFVTTAWSDPTHPLVGTRFFFHDALGPRLDFPENIILRNADPDLNEIFENEQKATDPAKKAELREAEQRSLVLENAFVIPLWDEVQVHGAAEGVHIEFTSSTAPDFHGAWKTAGN